MPVSVGCEGLVTLLALADMLPHHLLLGRPYLTGVDGLRGLAKRPVVGLDGPDSVQTHSGVMCACLVVGIIGLHDWLNEVFRSLDIRSGHQ